MRNKGVVPISKQSMIIAGLVALALGAMVLGTVYQGERDIGGPVVVGADFGDPVDDATDDTAQNTEPTPGGRVVGADGNLSQPSNNSGVNPIESFLPASPTGANCREAVGVDLIDGYAASLVINGQRIPAEDMNGADPETGAIPAGRTQGQYTFGPEEGCPNGTLLRPRDNVLQACVYKIEEGPETCVVSEFTFNAL